jgi:hypothetical protein
VDKIITLSQGDAINIMCMLLGALAIACLLVSMPHPIPKKKKGPWDKK